MKVNVTVVYFFVVLTITCSRGNAEVNSISPHPKQDFATIMQWADFVDLRARRVTSSPGQTPEEQAKADKAWEELFAPLDGLPGDTQGNYPVSAIKMREQAGFSVKYLAWLSRWHQRYRELGLRFWQDFPKDRRRWVWLANTVESDGLPDICYFKDPEGGAIAFIDLKRLIKMQRQESAADNPSQEHMNNANYLRQLDFAAEVTWARRYVLLRAEFLGAPMISEEEKTIFLCGELGRRIGEFKFYHRLVLSEEERELALGDLANEVLNHAVRYKDLHSDAGERPTEWMLDTLRSLNLRALSKSFLAAMKLSPNDEVKDLAYAEDIQPVKLSIGQALPNFVGVRTQKGDRIDLEQLHGKVVLIDFWALWCHSCIEQMPELKKIYEAYHIQGLESYGVCFCYTSENPADKAAKNQEIDALMARLGIPWVQCPRKDNSADPLWRQYSFEGVPHNFLIDKEGNLAAVDLYDPAKLREKIKELLAATKATGTGA